MNFATQENAVYASFELGLRLEARGVRFTLDAAGQLEVGPKDALEPADFRQVWQMRHEVARLVRYCEERRWEAPC